MSADQAVRPSSRGNGGQQGSESLDVADADLPRDPSDPDWERGPIRALRLSPGGPAPVVSEHTMRARRAAATARSRYPGPVGATVSAVLLNYADQGWQGAPHGLSERLVADLLDEAPD